MTEPSSQPQSLASTERALALAIALLAAAVAATSGAEPTGTVIWDELLVAATAGLFVLASPALPRWFLIPVAAIAMALSDDTIWSLVGLVGLVLAAAAALWPARNRLLDMLAAAVAIQGLLRLAPIGFFGLPSLIAGALIVAALLFGYRALSPKRRRVTRWSVAVIAFLAAITCTIGALVILNARTDVDNGITAARSGLSAARGGDPEAVVDELERAASALGNAEDQVGGLLARGLRLVPIAAQHQRAVETAVTRGRALASQASEATINADISTITLSTGSVDLSALEAMAPDLAETTLLLDDTLLAVDQVRTGWLIPFVDRRLVELRDEMIDVGPEARVAADAAKVLPALLGADEPRRYFVAFGVPAESRELGGFVGSWAVIEFDDGDLDLVDAGRINALYDLARANGPLDRSVFPAWYTRGQPGYWPQNITASPSIATVAEASRQLFDGIGDGSIDGFVYLDGFALGAMLELSGPVQLDAFETTVDAANARSFFFDEQYRRPDRDELKNELAEIFQGVFAGVLDRQLPGPERLGEILGPSARQGRLQVATFNDEENAFLQSVRLQREFALPADGSDAFAIVGANAEINKLDLYLERSVTYDAQLDGEGGLTATMTVELTSDPPPDAPEVIVGRDRPGVNQMRLSLYTLHEATSVSLNGETSDALITREFGFWRYEVDIEVTAETPATVVFDLVGTIDPEQPHAVTIWHQPLVNPDNVRLRSTSADGTIAEHTLELTEDVTIEMDE